jgi:D-sedoheptulose 7-phosphate isomerase
MSNEQSYTFKAIKALADLPYEEIEQAVRWLQICQKAGHTIWLVGNGGSASTAEHFACDLTLVGVKAIGLTSLMATLTALANDYDYGQALAFLLERYAYPVDGLIAISTSGNSANIIQAVKLAKARGLYTIGMTGKTGGELAKLVDINLAVQSDDMQVCEDLHLMMAHLISKTLKG